MLGVKGRGDGLNIVKGEGINGINIGTTVGRSMDIDHPSLASSIGQLANIN